MSTDKFDKELSQLYQQRKQQTAAPTLEIASTTTLIKSSRSPWQMLVLLLTGGVASFGIMALVTHFAKAPVHGSSEQYKQHSVRVIEIVEVNPEKIALPPVTPPLPPKPVTNIPKAINEKLTATAAITKPMLALNKPTENVVTVPTIKQPIFDIKPVYKVMPEYPKNALYARKSGTIKLQYRISYTGKVIDITGLNKHSDRVLERSAKQALSQWRYPKESGGDKFLEVEFEFNLAQ
jgi:TonB family protein